MRQTLLRAARAAVVILAHLIVAVVLILAIAAVDHLIRFLNGGGEMLVFGRLPLSYLFQAGDVAMIAVFTVNGVIEAVEIMRE